MIQHESELRRKFETEGTLYFEPGTTCFSDADWDELEKLCKEVPIERVVTGDAGEPNYVDVGRFVTDINRPELVNRPLSDRAVEIVTQKKAVELFSEILGTDKIFVRRMQVNKFGVGGFVGLHLDTDSNPDYHFACILQFGDEYEGGEFVVHKGEEQSVSLKPEYRSITISNSSFPHEVLKVTKGERASFVFFISDSGAENKTPPPPSILEDPATPPTKQ